MPLLDLRRCGGAREAAPRGPMPQYEEPEPIALDDRIENLEADRLRYVVVCGDPLLSNRYH